MKKVLIITGGEYDPSFDATEYDYIIACDKGYEYTQRLSIIPDVVIGDFDSCSEINPSDNITVLKYPVRKDDTDTMLAIKHALELGYTHISLACALGLRMDHTIANIQSMHYVAAHGGVCEILSSREYMRTLTPLNGTISIAKREGFHLSLFALTDVVTDVTIEGTSYDCVTNLCNHFPLGHGNHFVGSHAQLSIKEGALLIVCSHE